ncbi:MAG: hypothetical protein CW691_01590, partial [Candidatus Bathyarchaeum sp.]
MPYCENCGKELKPTAKFCGNCGTPVEDYIQPKVDSSPAPVTTAPQPVPSTTAEKSPAPSTTEPVLGVLILRKPKSLGRYDTYSGVLTPQRLIFAQMTSDMLKEAINQSRAQAKAEGKGFFGQWGEQLKASASFAGRYYNIEPSVILSETPGNFALSNNTINEIKLKLKTYGNPDNNQQEFEVEFKGSSGNYKYRMDENNDYLNMLKQVYGDRVKK